MSILIKGMKMPKNCDKCILSSSTAMRCDATKKSLVTDTYPKRPSWCPLVKVPEPHGRLIDADKFMKPFCDLLEKDEHSLDYYSVGYTGLNAMISDSPTVIESEGREHE